MKTTHQIPGGRPYFGGGGEISSVNARAMATRLKGDLAGQGYDNNGGG
ncbi:MAG: hypothetical protein M1472_03425 [Planctomycetes bacterium]|nr:hypothetical protein [Planctomycetota bacterium]